MEYIEVARKAAHQAGIILRENLGRVKEVEYKSKNSLVTEVDRTSEDLIIRAIKAEFPNHSIFAEESGGDSINSRYRWIIDPLDGTTNYTHTYPFFSVSIALEIEGEISMGLVYDPVKEETFSAEKGKGSKLNNNTIDVSISKKVEESNLCTGFIHSQDWMVEENIVHFGNFIRRARAVRRDGSAALDLCYVACGRYDGFWELGLNPWDTAAGFLILEEAGGRVTDFGENKYSINSEEIVATNGLIHDEVLKVLSLGRSNKSIESRIKY
ncbi:MAG: inositol monophosphatase family protein [Thermodesulfobacteriota bacterium]